MRRKLECCSFIFSVIVIALFASFSILIIEEDYAISLEELQKQCAQQGISQDNDKQEEFKVVSKKRIKGTVMELESLNKIELRECEEDMEKRRAIVKDVCQKFSLNQIPLNPREFYIAENNSLVWCNVFKAGSTSWFYILNQMAGYPVEFLDSTRNVPVFLARNKYPFVSKFDLKLALHSSFSFIVSRHPFERIASSFENKLKNKRDPLYRDMAHRIVAQYRYNRTQTEEEKKDHSLGMPTFSEFIKHLLTRKREDGDLNMHWRTVFDTCSVCQAEFEFIMRFDTFDRDQTCILQKSGNLNKVKVMKLNSSKSKKKNKDKADGWWHSLYDELSEEDLQDLCQVFKYDFLLFDYTWEKCNF